MYKAKILILHHKSISMAWKHVQFLRASRDVARKKYNENEILIVDRDLLSSYLWFGIPFMLRFYIFMIPFAICHIFGRKYTFLAISQEYVLPLILEDSYVFFMTLFNTFMALIFLKFLYTESI